MFFRTVDSSVDFVYITEDALLALRQFLHDELQSMQANKTRFLLKILRKETSFRSIVDWVADYVSQTRGKLINILTKDFGKEKNIHMPSLTPTWTSEWHYWLPVA